MGSRATLLRPSFFDSFTFKRKIDTPEDSKPRKLPTAELADRTSNLQKDIELLKTRAGLVLGPNGELPLDSGLRRHCVAECYVDVKAKTRTGRSPESGGCAQGSSEKEGAAPAAP